MFRLPVRRFLRGNPARSVPAKLLLDVDLLDRVARVILAVFRRRDAVPRDAGVLAVEVDDLYADEPEPAVLECAAVDNGFSDLRVDRVGPAAVDRAAAAVGADEH